MENDYVKQRRQLRLNLFLAMLLLIGAAMFCMIYGVVYMVNSWQLSSEALGYANGAFAFVLCFMLIGLFGVIYKRLNKRLEELKGVMPQEVDQ